MFKKVKKKLECFKNFFGDYSRIQLDHSEYEKKVTLSGVCSGESLYHKCIQIIEKNFAMQKDVAILDLGCGGGMFGRTCKQRQKDYVIDGVDLFVPEKNKLTKEGVYRKIIEKNILDYDFLDDYDIVVSNQFFEHLEKKQALQIFERIFKRKFDLLVSVPLAYHTFAYNEDYLFASVKENTELNDLQKDMLIAETHKSYFTRKEMSGMGFTYEKCPTYFSNFFYRKGRATVGLQVNSIQDVVKIDVDGFLTQYYKRNKASLPRPINRRDYEKCLAAAIISEPKSFIFIRRMILFFLHPVRIIKRMVV